ncbi:MAG: cation transporter [Deltaproteobacteria bacterium]|nr:cation transporter [Deltaproteobacteria bacterium]
MESGNVKNHHEHGHHHSGDVEALGGAFLLNFIFTLIEIAGGLWTNSVAILADALHDAGDSLALLLAWYLQKASGKERDQRFSYGYGRLSLLAALINGVILLAGSIVVIVHVIPRLFEPQIVDATGMFWLALLGIAFNGFAFWRNRSSQSLNAKMVNWHLLEDVLGWTVVLAGSIVMHFGDYPWLDPLMALGVTLFILWNVFKSLGRVTKIFLQSNPEGLDLSAIENELRTLNNVEDIHDVHAWSLDGKYHVLSLHVVISQITDQESLVLLKNQIRDQLHKMGIEHSTIEFELPTEACVLENC